MAIMHVMHAIHADWHPATYISYFDKIVYLKCACELSIEHMMYGKLFCASVSHWLNFKICFQCLLTWDSNCSVCFNCIADEIRLDVNLWIQPQLAPKCSAQQETAQYRSYAIILQHSILKRINYFAHTHPSHSRCAVIRLRFWLCLLRNRWWNISKRMNWKLQENSMHSIISSDKHSNLNLNWMWRLTEKGQSWSGFHKENPEFGVLFKI